MQRLPARSNLLIILVIAVAVPVAAHGQRPAADTMFAHAHRLVGQGQGDAGRAMIDSLLGATTPGSAAYAEGLFWRAVTATRAADAERDYLRIVIEYPLSPRAEDALIRLAELEMMRGDRVRAQRHLQRLIIEHPNGASRARASYWLARVFFDGNDLPRGCNELNVARSRAAPTDVELRNQVEYQAQRCVGVAVVAPSPQAPAAGVAPGVPAPASAVSSTPPSAGVTSPPAAATRPPTTPVTGAQGAPAGNAAAPPVVTASPPVSTAPTTMSPPPPTTVPAPVPTAPGRSSPGFSVQVAAFPTQAAADKFRESLAARGYDVRVWGVEAPFRVRVGRFATRAEAGALAQELRGKMIAKDAYVVEAEVR